MRHFLTVYWNGGQVYKKEFRPESGDAFSVCSCQATGVASEYFVDPDGKDNLHNFFAIKSGSGGSRRKRYSSTEQVNRLIGAPGGVGIDGFDLAPDVSLWLSVGRFVDSSEDVELYFHVDRPFGLPAIACHYRLPDPITDEQKRNIEQNPMAWRERILKPKGMKPVPVVVGSVAFESGKPTRLKVYQFHRQQ